MNIDKDMLARLAVYRTELYVNGRDLSACLVSATMYGDLSYQTFTLDSRAEGAIEHLKFLQERDSSGVTVFYRARQVIDGQPSGEPLPYQGTVGILKAPQLLRVPGTDEIHPAEATYNLVLCMTTKHFGDLEDVTEIDKMLRELALLECPLTHMFVEPKAQL